MKILLKSIVLVGLFAVPAFGETIITPNAFEKLSTGKTMYFTRNGQFYGAEQFYSRRRSLWQYADKECADGVWFPKGDLICFTYDENKTQQCWHFIEKSDGFVARSEGSSEEFDILMDKVDDKPLDCKGPAVGA